MIMFFDFELNEFLYLRVIFILVGRKFNKNELNRFSYDFVINKVWEVKIYIILIRLLMVIGVYSIEIYWNMC